MATEGFSATEALGSEKINLASVCSKTWELGKEGHTQCLTGETFWQNLPRTVTALLASNSSAMWQLICLRGKQGKTGLSLTVLGGVSFPAAVLESAAPDTRPRRRSRHSRRGQAARPPCGHWAQGSCLPFSFLAPVSNYQQGGQAQAPQQGPCGTRGPVFPVPQALPE